jgi:hypothetical protein
MVLPDPQDVGRIYEELNRNQAQMLGLLQLSREDSHIPRPKPSWIDHNYHLIMLLAMVAELALLTILVILEWTR